MQKKTVRDIDVNKKRVLVRVDFNVPMDSRGTITDDLRIRAVLPTINYLISRQARIILCSHLGRPKGKVVEELRLAPVAKRLSEIINKKVEALKDCIGPQVDDAVAKLSYGEILLLENLRFYPQEEANDPDFARKLSRLADVYVNDAFGTCHRTHASVVGIPRYLPAVSGLLLEKELNTLTRLMTNPDRPFAAVIGGAKVATKLPLLKNILPKVDFLLIGGGMIATFLKSQGYRVGTSTVDSARLEEVARFIQNAKSIGARLLIPHDLVIAPKLEANSSTRIVPIDRVPDDWVIVDIGTETIESFAKELDKCKTVFWNGPLGVFEIPQFAEGTRSMARTLANLKAITVIGGGSTAEAVVEMGLKDRMTYISTGGGASIEMLQGNVLPGVAALQDSSEEVKNNWLTKNLAMPEGG